MKKIFAELALLMGTVLTVSAGDIVINEIMYHPQSENIREQWIELHNTTGSAIDLSGWAFTKGISYTFAEGTMIEADGYLVITADVEAFAMVYPNVTNVIGNWEGKLSNRGENIRLTKANGKTETEVHYAPEGDWAQRRPDYNFIGVDIKGARMWTGAQEALHQGMKNVGFLRTNIEFIQEFFAPGEVSEIWLTFSDPQMKKATKRLSSTFFLNRYRQFLQDNGLIHLKTDSNFLFTYTEELLRANNLTAEASTRNLYAADQPRTVHERLAASIQTYYESMWQARGIDIKYLCFRLPQEGYLAEPDVEIPLDEYRSYSREKRSSKSVGK